MADRMKPASRSGYPSGQRTLLRATCIELARALPATVADHVTLIGGVVPSLRVAMVPDDPHPGSFDLDLGLEMGVGDATVLAELEAHLGRAGFGPGLDKQGNETKDTWRYPAGSPDPSITLDLILGGAGPRTWLPEIRFAFVDRVRVVLEGEDFAGREGRGELWVCGLASFVLLKALAFRRRRERKDAFDLYWSLRYWPNGWNELHSGMLAFMRDARARELLQILAQDFSEDGDGPKAAGLFASGDADEHVEADATGLVRRALELIGWQA